MHDVRYALRSIRNNPGYAAIVILTLALGLGATGALFNVADATMLAPLPFPGSERAVHLYDRQPAFEFANASWPEMTDWRGQARSLDLVAAQRGKAMSWRGSSDPEQVKASLISDGFFRIFATGAAAGRLFTPEEHAAGAPPVAVLGWGFWQRAFAGDPGIIGRTVTLSGEVYTVVGVLADGGANLPRGPQDVWIPIEPRLPSRERGAHYLTAYGRLAPQITLAQARAELDALGPALDTDNSGHMIGIRSVREAMYGKAQGGVTIVFVGALLVLLIAGANIANLMIARMSGRTHELGVRAALGAGRWRLVRQLLTETLILSLLGGAVGILLVLWGKDLLLSMWPANAPKPTVTPLDPRTLLFMLITTVMVGVLVGVAPALRGSRADLSTTLRIGAVPRTGILRAVLVVAQYALALTLLVGAGLFGKSLVMLLAQNPGFDPAHILALNIAPPDRRYPDGERKRDFYEAILDRLRALPGVESASAVSDVPFGTSQSGGTFEIEGRPAFPSNNRPQTNKLVVDGEYFRSMRIPLLQGRSFTPADREVKIIINKTFADRYFPGESPLGKRIDAWGGLAEVVGVVGDTRQRALDDPAELQIYLNLAEAQPWTSFVIRAAGDPLQLAGAAKAQVYAVDPAQSVSSVGTLDDLVSQSAANRRGVAVIVAGFAAVALLLAALGVYGVLSYSVTRRTREIGVRMALGAETRTVVRLILGQGMILALIGSVIGVVVTLILAPLGGEYLYRVSPSDPLIYIGVAAVLLGVGLLACFLPARRAARVDPMTALRYE